MHTLKNTSCNTKYFVTSKCITFGVHVIIFPIPNICEFVNFVSCQTCRCMPGTH